MQQEGKAVSFPGCVVGKPGWLLLPLPSSSRPKAMRVSRVRSGEQGQYFSVQGLLTTPDC